MSDAPVESSSAPAFRPSKARLYGGVAIVLAALGGGGFFLFRRADNEATERETKAWSWLSTCLIGAPLPKGASPAVPLRKIQLRAIAETVTNRLPSEGDPWPFRCAAPAVALHDVLLDTGRAATDAKDLADAAALLAKRLKDQPPGTTDIADLVEPLFAQAAKAGLVAQAGEGGVAPPEPVETLTMDALKTVAPLAAAAFPLDTVFGERVAAGPLRLLAASKDLAGGPLLCTFTEAADAVHCDALPAPILAASKDLRLLGSTEAAAKPLVFAAKRGDGGVFRSEGGDRLDALYSYGGFSRADGFAATVGWDEATDKKKPFRMARKRAGAPAVIDRFKLEGIRYALNDVAVLWDWVVWEDLESGARSLRARRILDGDAPLGPAVTIGPLDDYERVVDYEHADETLRGCKTDEALAVVINGSGSDSVAFQTGDRWVSPLPVAGTGGTLTCRGTEATLTTVSTVEIADLIHAEIRQDRCTPAGCSGGHVRIIDLTHHLPELAPADAKSLSAVDLDGKLLVVWVAGALGGVRMRLGPIDRIAGEPDTVVLDDLTREGRVERAHQIFDLRLFARGRFAVLLVTSSLGVHAIRIDADGKVTPMKRG